jgi:hypothetical protein
LLASRGSIGAAGPRGLTGLTGATGTWDVNTYTGAYNEFGFYDEGDIVEYEGSSYVAIADGSSLGQPGTTGGTGHWGLLAAKGTDGADGTNGANGADGTNGANGADGATGAVGETGATGPIGTWDVNTYTGTYSSGTTYATGDIAFYEGSSYVALTSGSSLGTPGATGSTGDWGILAAGGSDAYVYGELSLDNDRAFNLITAGATGATGASGAIVEATSESGSSLVTGSVIFTVTGSGGAEVSCAFEGPGVESATPVLQIVSNPTGMQQMTIFALLSEGSDAELICDARVVFGSSVNVSASWSGGIGHTANTEDQRNNRFTVTSVPS